MSDGVFQPPYVSISKVVGCRVPDDFPVYFEIPSTYPFPGEVGYTFASPVVTIADKAVHGSLLRRLLEAKLKERSKPLTFSCIPVPVYDSFRR